MKKNRYLVGLLFAVCLIAASCGERRPYVLAEMIEVEFKDTLKVDDWISIDGVKYTHVNDYDRIKDDTTAIETVFDLKILPSSVQNIVIPGAGEKELRGYTPTSGVAFALLQALSLSEKNDLGMFYGFTGHTLEMSSGKLKFYRKDGEKVKVMTSDGYTGIIRKVK
ncbi:hypothetical protein [Roseivirga misakiensis]|uniref:Uncharacterized protein n=1 Tax=Roseivirga misakiensis TaxID=1563681 RepID=A0A1E5T2T5_9BACT|nr:hypothetical protein [Roseivirga misakiensis]OEK05682.1 hypothetical protein BFP71_06045 [Roseivirga misakiensis]